MQQTAVLASFGGVVDRFEAAGLALEVEDGVVEVVGTHHVAAAATEVDPENADCLLLALGTFMIVHPAL